MLAPIGSSRWDFAAAKHLLNRAGFGVPHALVLRLAAMTPEAAVDYLVDYDAVYDKFRVPDFLVDPLSPAEVDKLTVAMSRSELQKATQAGQDLERENLGMLQAWWVDRMLTTTRPLREKLTLFWHGHFATSAQKVRESWFNYHLNATFREHAAGNFKKLTLAVGRSPAMLHYLDNVRNVKNGPNENWARELLELFTMGHGHYTETDIKEAARGFTGWTANHRAYIFNSRAHDYGSKNFLGRTGEFNGRDIVDIIFEQPETARFIARKLWEFFAYADPEPAIVDALAQTLRANDYELRPMVRQMFLSQAFYSDRAVGTQVKSPVQLFLMLCHDLAFDVAPLTAVNDAFTALGQRLFYPPSVKGWDGGRAWINANTLTHRYNLPVALVMASLKDDKALAKIEMKNATSMAMSNGHFDESVDFSGSMGKLMDAIPRELRADLATRLGFNAPEYRRFLRAHITRWKHRGQWNAHRVFRELQFTTSGECLGALERRYLSVPLGAEQRTVLLKALGANGDRATLRHETLSEQRMNETLHLLFSTAEYQLC